jgi:CheY-like chemotaxis protein
MKFELLLIDDDEIFLMLNAIEVERTGFHTAPLKFSFGEDALDYLRINDVEGSDKLLFLDINMPVMDGWDLLNALRKLQLKSNIYVVMLAASTDPRDHQKSKEYSEIVDYVEKPITKESLEKLKLIEKLKTFFCLNID